MCVNFLSVCQKVKKRKIWHKNDSLSCLYSYPDYCGELRSSETSWPAVYACLCWTVCTILVRTTKTAGGIRMCTSMCVFGIVCVRVSEYASDTVSKPTTSITIFLHSPWTSINVFFHHCLHAARFALCDKDMCIWVCGSWTLQCVFYLILCHLTTQKMMFFTQSEMAKEQI